MNDPKPPLRRCDNPTCRRLDATLRYDPGLRRWLCSDCSRSTPVPPEARSPARPPE